MSSVEDLIRRALGLERKQSTTPVWRILETARADPYAVDWVRSYGTDIIGAWSECPRVDWLVAMAVHLGIEKERVVEAVDACLMSLGPTSAQSARSSAEAIEAMKSWLLSRKTFEESLAILWQSVEDTIEEDPKYSEASKIARRFRVVGPLDEAYHGAQRRLVNQLREELPLELFEIAYNGCTHSPYR